jgi:glyoxylase-like metal-dependent hydrolase (beta-lactamase superfamily II)
LRVGSGSTGARQTNAPIVSGAHRFEKVADGIFYATASGTMSVGSNSPIIVSGDEALVIDSETSPAAGRALVADVKAVTPKPVRVVVDSHYHYDHAFGNQVFGPEVEIIGHDNTWLRLSTNETLEQFTFKRSLERVPPAVEAFKKELAQTTMRSRRRRSSVRSPTISRIWNRSRKSRSRRRT